MPRTAMHRLAGPTLLLVIACGPSATVESAETTPHTETAGEEAQRPTDPSASDTPPSARVLAPDASFADLVGAARRQDQLRDQDSDAGCLLRAGAAPRLEADLAAAVRPLPEVPPSLAPRLRSVAVLTRYGAIGQADAALGLVAFTTTRPAAARARVVVITREGLFRGATDAARFERVEVAALGTIDDGTSHVFVTAEASISVTALAEVLAALPRTLAGRVGLAVALPEDTRLPAAPAREDLATAPVCELSPADETGPWGELDVDAIRAGVAPLVERARFCAGSTEGPGALGGRVVLSLRVDPSGRVAEACVSEDETDDGALRACLTAAARELSIGPPRGGSIDIALPLRIEPGIAHRQLALCES